MVYYTPLPVVMQHDPEIERTTHGCLSSVEPSSHSVFQYNLAPRRAQIINLSNNIAIEDTSNFEQRTPQHDTICQIKVKPNGIDYSQSRESTEILNQTTSYQGMKTPKFECMHCNIYFGSKSAYMSHIKSHTKEQNTLSSTKSIGVRDVRSGQNSRSHLSDQHQCDICKKTFAVPARLIRHYRTHTGERPFECEFCHKMFSVKENLQVHRRIHTKERPYKCNVCERAFEHSGKLHRHMRIHTGERPHKCNVCGKTFIQSGQLVIHMRTHTGEKPYRCPEVGCLKGFTCSKQLKVHSRTHSGEKPYRCDVCGRDFGYNHVLKLHRVQHYGSKCYKCTICEETFKSKKEMEAHIKDHANDTTDDEPLLQKARVFQAEQLVSTDESNKEEIVTNREDSYKYRVYQHFESHITSQYAVQSSMNPVALLAAASIVASAQERSEVQPICSAPSISPISLSPCTYNNATNVITNKRQTFSNNLSQGLEFKPLLQSSDELVKRVEAALGCTSMTEPETPPRSSSDQDDRSSSPEYDSLHVHERRDNNTLPPRKRRLYFKDDHENFITTRVSSVIHFAKSK